MSFDEKYAEWKKKKKEQYTQGGIDDSFESRYNEWKFRTHGEDIVNDLNQRINAWMAGVDTTISSHNDRYKVGNAVYRPDANDWYERVKSLYNTTSSSAESIKADLDRYGKYLNKDWTESVYSAIDGNLSSVEKILNASIEDRNFMSNFKDEDDFNINFGYDQKYKGKTFDEIKAASAEATGTEAVWLKSYSENYGYKDDAYYTAYTKSVDDRLAEIDSEIKAAKAEGRTTTNANFDQKNVPSNVEYIRQDEIDELEWAKSELQAEKQRVLKKRGSFEDIQVANPESSYYDSNFEKSSEEGWNKYLADKKEYEDYLKRLDEEKNTPPEGFWQAIGWALSQPDVSNQPGSSSPESVGFEFAELYDHYWTDKSYEMPSEDWSQEEKDLFGYYYLKDQEKAFERAIGINNAIAAEKRADEAEKIRESATSSWWAGTGHTVASIFAGATGLADYIDNVAEYAARGTITEKSTLTPFDYSQEVTGAITTDLNENFGTLDEDIPIIGGKGWGDVYGVGKGILDSAASAYALGGVGTAINYFGQGAASSIDDALARGADPGQAIAFGTLAGVAEAATEYMGAEKLLSLGSSELKQSFIKTLLKQGGAEAIEEGTSSLLTTFADNLVMQDKSKLNTAIREYAVQGMSYSEATKKAWLDAAEEAAYSAAVGFVSGAVHAVVPATAQSYRKAKVNSQNKKVYAPTMEDAQALVSEGLESPKGSDSRKIAEELQAKIDGGKKLSGADITRLVAANEQAIRSEDIDTMKTAAAERLKTLGESGDVSAIADVIAKQASGETLTRSEQAVLKNSKYGIRVSNEMSPENVGTGEYSNAWAENIGTERINKDAYNYVAENIQSEDTQNNPLLALAAEKAGVKMPNARVSLSGAIGSVGAENFSAVKKSVSKTIDIEDRVSADGKTTQKSTGKAITIDKNNPIAKTVKVNGNEVVYFNTNQGEVEVGDISYSNETEGLIYEGFTDLSPAIANAAIKAYDGKTPAQAFINGMREGILVYGKYNFQAVGKDISAESDFARLSAVDQKLALELGREAAEIETTAADKKLKSAIRSAAKNVGKDSKGKPAKKGKVTFEKDVEAITDKQKVAVDFANKLAEVTGIQIIFYDSKVNPKHKLAGDDGASSGDTIWLDMSNSHEDAIIYTLSHEFVHFAKQWSPKKFKIFADFMVEQFADHDKPLEQLVRQKMVELKTNDLDYAFEEVVADACERMLLDSKAMEKLAKLKQKDPNIFKEFIQHIKDLITKIRSLYKDIDATNDYSEALQAMDGVMDRFYELFEDMAVDAVQNFQTSQALETESVSVSKDGTIQMQQAKKSNNDVQFVEDKFFKSQMAKWETLKHGSYVKVGEIREGNPLCLVGMPDGIIRYDVDKLKKNMADHGDYLSVALLNEIPNIISDPIAISEFSEENTVSVFGDIFIGKSPMMVGVTISKDRAGNDISKVRTYNTRRDVGNLITDDAVLYLNENKKRTQKWFQACGIQVPLGGTKFGFIRSIAQNPEPVKKQKKLVAKDSKSLYNVSNGDYSSVAWVLNNDLLTPAEVKQFNSTLADIKKHNYNPWMQLDKGSFVIDVGSKLILTEGTMENPHILDILSYVEDDKYQFEIIKESIKDAINFRPDRARSKSAWETVLDSYVSHYTQELVRHHFRDFSTAKGYDFYGEGILRRTNDGDNSQGSSPKRDSSSNTDSGRKGEEQEVKFQKKKISNRTLLANALESAIDTSSQEGKNELAMLRKFQEDVAKFEELEHRLAEVNAELKEVSFGKGKRDVKRQRELTEEKTKLVNRMDIYDRRLLKYEATKPIKDLLAREKEKIRKQYRAEGSERVRVALNRKNDSVRLKKEKESLQKLVLETTAWIANPKKGEVPCPDIIKEPLADFLAGIDTSSKKLLTKGVATQRDLKFVMAMDSLATAVEKIKNSQDPSKENAKVLCDGYLDLPPDFVENIRAQAEAIKNYIKLASEGDSIINDMSADELKELSRIIKMLKKSIKEMQSLYTNYRFANAVALGKATMGYLNSLGAAKEESKFKDFAVWDNAVPYYAFKRFGEGGESIFESLMDAQDKLAFHADEILAFKEKNWTDKEVSSWSKEVQSISLENGEELKFTAADAMSIYCLSKRYQAVGHLLGGGVRVIGATKGGKKAADSVANLSPLDVEAICNTLTDRQKEVANKMQEFMTTVCADWGNEIWMKRFLTKNFTEKNYFPIESDPNTGDKKDPAAKQSDLFRLLNISATKPLADDANNKIVIRNVFDVFTAHTSDMARLNAYGMALLDYMKWLNYRERHVDSETGQVKLNGVRPSLEEAYGSAAEKYIVQLIKDINGTSDAAKDNAFSMKMIRSSKVAAVGANLRVAALQITALPRAGIVLDTKSIILGMRKLPNIKKAKKYCGIALWKSFGFYDTNIGKSIESQIKGDTKISEKMVELSMKGAELGDRLVFGYLWNACEYEIAKTKQYKVGSEEFNQAVAKKLREVVYASQVVDSVLTKSQLMRSKSGLNQMVSAFMSEPTLTYNVLLDCKSQFDNEAKRTGSKKAAWKATKGIIVRGIASYVVTNILTALAEGFADAFRDDDDDPFGEKFIEAFWENFLKDINPLNKIPIFNDIVSFVESRLGYGYFSSGDATTGYLDTVGKAYDAWVDIIKNGEDAERPLYYAIYNTAKAFSQFSGLPISNVMREVVTLWNNTAGTYDYNLKIRTYEPSDSTNAENLYQAILSGDTKQQGKLESLWEDETERQKDLKTVIGSHFKEGDIDSAAANQYLKEYCGIEDDDIHWQMDRWQYAAETGSSEGYAKYDDFFTAVESGKNLRAVIQEYTNNGVEKSTLASQITGHFKPLYKEMSNYERASLKGYLLNAYSVLGYERSKKSKDIDKWLKQ